MALQNETENWNWESLRHRKNGLEFCHPNFLYSSLPIKWKKWVSNFLHAKLEDPINTNSKKKNEIIGINHKIGLFLNLVLALMGISNFY